MPENRKVVASLYALGSSSGCAVFSPLPREEPWSREELEGEAGAECLTYRSVAPTQRSAGGLPLRKGESPVPGTAR